MKPIQNLIFDLGNVIINIDVPLTVQALVELAPEKSASLAQEVLKTDFFFDFEVGRINDQEFREGMRAKLGDHVTDEAIDLAWNALLLDIPPARLDLIQALREDYRLFLLSNTNNIHIECIVRQMEEEGQPALEELFEKVYYSHDMGLRKPDPEIYQQVLEENSLIAEETAFLDDNESNIISARELGIHGIHILPGQNSILDFFNEDADKTFQIKL